MNNINKIESCENLNSIISNQSSMKPIYSTNEELMCGEIKYNNRTYLVDFSSKDKIINSKNKFIFETVVNIF